MLVGILAVAAVPAPAVASPTVNYVSPGGATGGTLGVNAYINQEHNIIGILPCRDPANRYGDGLCAFEDREPNTIVAASGCKQGYYGSNGSTNPYWVWCPRSTKIQMSLGGGDDRAFLGGWGIRAGFPGAPTITDEAEGRFYGNSEIQLGAGHDNVIGGKGNDNVFGGPDSDLLRGGDGNDTLHGDGGADDIFGDANDDVIYGGAGALETGYYDKLRGNDGQDTIYGGDNNTSDSERDYLYGYEGVDELHGEGGGDYLYGGDDVDYAYGGSGNDSVQGDAQADYLYGESGTDQLDGADNDGSCSDGHPDEGDLEPAVCSGAATDVLDCGTGSDTGWVAQPLDNVVRSSSDSGCENPGRYPSAYVSAERVIYDAGQVSREQKIFMQPYPNYSGIDFVAFYDNFGNAIQADPETGCRHRTDQFDQGGLGYATVTCDYRDTFDTQLRGGDDSFLTSNLSYGGRLPLVSIIDGGSGSDFIQGGRFNDVIYGGPGNDKSPLTEIRNCTFTSTCGLLRGGYGDDRIVGGEGDDTIMGGKGEDTIYGDGSTDAPVSASESGDDIILGGPDTDKSWGGSGDDLLDNEEKDFQSFDEVYGQKGHDVLYADDGVRDVVDCGGDHPNDEAERVDRIDEVSGCAKVEYVDGGSQGDTWLPTTDAVIRDGRLTVVGASAVASNIAILRAGASYYVVDNGAEVSAASGCVVVGTNVARCDLASSVSATLGDRDDVLIATGLDVPLAVDAGDGADRVYGGAKADMLTGSPGDDTLVGCQGSDRYEGGAGDDNLSDAARGYCLDSVGDDVFDGGTGADQMAGWSGTDTVDYSQRVSDLTVTLNGGPYGPFDDGGGPDVSYTFSGEELTALKKDNVNADIENVLGGAGDDKIYDFDGGSGLSGGAGNDRLEGGAGTDVLLGGDGGDVLVGQAGIDGLLGQEGTDQLYGGPDDDYYKPGPGEDFSSEFFYGAGSGRDKFDIYESPADRDTIGDCGPEDDVAVIRDSKDQTPPANCDHVRFGP